jgi:hypothetical protein
MVNIIPIVIWGEKTMTWTQTEIRKIIREIRLQMKDADSSDFYVRGWRHALKEVEWALAKKVEKQQTETQNSSLSPR